MILDALCGGGAGAEFGIWFNDEVVDDIDSVVVNGTPVVITGESCGEAPLN